MIRTSWEDSITKLPKGELGVLVAILFEIFFLGFCKAVCTCLQRLSSLLLSKRYPICDPSWTNTPTFKMSLYSTSLSVGILSWRLFCFDKILFLKLFEGDFQKKQPPIFGDTVDGSQIRRYNQLMLVVYVTMIYDGFFSHHARWCSPDFFHQQYFRYK